MARAPWLPRSQVKGLTFRQSRHASLRDDTYLAKDAPVGLSRALQCWSEVFGIAQAQVAWGALEL